MMPLQASLRSSGFRGGIEGATLVHPFEEFLLKKAENAFSV